MKINNKEKSSNELFKKTIKKKEEESKNQLRQDNQRTEIERER